MNSFRRFLVLQTFAFCFGGFLFYAGVVVPTGTHVLGSTTQGFITRDVTKTLNIATLLCVALLYWEAYAGRSSRSQRMNRILNGLICGIAICCLSLFWLHGQLNSKLSTEDFAVIDTANFYSLHRLYLWISTVQWLCSLPLLWILANSRPAGARLPDSN